MKVLKIIGLCVWVLIIVFITIPVPAAGILLALATLLIYFAYRISRGTKAYKEKHNIPKDALKITYYGGYDKKLYPWLYYWKDTDKLYLHEIKPIEKNSDPIKLTITKDDIIAFSSTGDLTSNTAVKGGGVSVGGAAAGAVIAGPIGAIIGGRKKVKSHTETKDTRRTILKFSDNGTEKTIALGYRVFDDLNMLCLEKKVG